MAPDENDGPRTRHNSLQSADPPAHSHEHEHEHEHEHSEHEHGKEPDAGAAHDHQHEHEHDHIKCIDISVGTSSIGGAIAMGFVFMLLVDRLSGGHSHGFDADSHGHGGDHPSDVEMAPLAHQGPHAHHETVPRRFDQSATVGILVHSAVDGVALGAISVSENSSLELVVFLAIILHKAPAAFGLASFLLYQGRPLEEIRSHLFIFSMAAPATALLTYFLLGQQSAVNAGDQTTLGLCLLFSGGTFLFTVAVHILPEVQKNQGEQVEWKYTAALIAGILAPLILSNEHTHAHAHGH